MTRIHELGLEVAARKTEAVWFHRLLRWRRFFLLSRKLYQSWSMLNGKFHTRRRRYEVPRAKRASQPLRNTVRLAPRVEGARCSSETSPTKYWETREKNSLPLYSGSQVHDSVRGPNMVRWSWKKQRQQEDIPPYTT